MVVTQLVERLLPIPENRGSNPAISNFIPINCVNNFIEKTKIKKKWCREWPKNPFKLFTFFERRFLVLLKSLRGDGLEPDPGRGVILQDLPHVLLAKDKQVWVAHRPDRGSSPVSWNFWWILFSFWLYSRKEAGNGPLLKINIASTNSYDPFLEYIPTPSG